MDKEEVIYIYTMEYSLALKKNKIMTFAATWMDLEILILSEVSQISYDGTYRWNLKHNENELIYRTETNSRT